MEDKNNNNEEGFWIDSLRVTSPKIPPKGEWKMSVQEIQELQKVRDEITKKRGKVISSALLIEKLLEVMIINTFFNKDVGNLTKEKELFGGAMLEREFFTFMSKWHVFRELCHSHPSLKDHSDLLKELKEIVDIRNRFAHGEVIFKEGKNPNLIYFQNGRKEQPLSDSYFEELRVKFARVHTTMWEVLELEIKEYGKNSV